ncbi:MAG: sigma-70 family RNA polymerase sigma factor [Ruminococcaceae bacterium]|nr:sigma-70 family RNA polymerase sigma factor [Oscillospiraceae bacterium]
MDDNRIVQLLFDRDEQAIPSVIETYGGYCMSIASNILGSREDAEECVCDAYLKLWNTIPPNRPARLSTFLGKIVRNTAFTRYKRSRADKRGGGELPLALDELAEVVSDTEGVEEALEAQALSEAINGFLDSLPPRKRMIFVRRYWHTDSIADIADRFGLSVGAVTMLLKRTRQKLKKHLEERGLNR